MSARTRNVLMGSAAAALVMAGTCALRSEVSAQESDPRLAPLARLMGGAWYERGEADGSWRTRTVYGWELGGQQVREETIDLASGRTLRLAFYFWHPRKNEIALVAHLDGGEVQEGMLRANADGFEKKFSSFLPEGRVPSYHEQIRFLDPDRLVSTVHRKTDPELILERETTLYRRRP